MVTVIFLAVCPQGQDRSLHYGCPNIETCFEALTFLSRKGWHLLHIELIDNGHHTLLPVEAFDGQPIKKHLEQLRHEWESILISTSRP